MKKLLLAVFVLSLSFSANAFVSATYLNLSNQVTGTTANAATYDQLSIECGTGSTFVAITLTDLNPAKTANIGTVLFSPYHTTGYIKGEIGKGSVLKGINYYPGVPFTIYVKKSAGTGPKRWNAHIRCIGAGGLYDFKPTTANYVIDR